MKIASKADVIVRVLSSCVLEDLLNYTLNEHSCRFISTKSIRDSIVRVKTDHGVCDWLSHVVTQ